MLPFNIDSAFPHVPSRMGVTLRSGIYRSLQTESFRVMTIPYISAMPYVALPTSH
jgi:hypothetical protein